MFRIADLLYVHIVLTVFILQKQSINKVIVGRCT